MAKKKGRTPTLQEYLADRAAYVRDSAANVFIDQQLPDVPKIPSQGIISRGLASLGMSDDTRYNLFGTEENPFTCIYTVTTKYGDKDAVVTGNKTFKENPEKYGFVSVPMNIDSLQKGDLVQFTPNGAPYPDHAAMITGDAYDSYNNKPIPFVSYSRGGTGDYTDVRGEFKKTMVHGNPLPEMIKESGKPSVYRYVGTSNKQQEWTNEYNKKYPKQKSFRTGTTSRWAEGGFLKPQNAWEALSMQEKADMMEIAIKNGITNLKDIRQSYNEFAENGE